MNDWYEELVDSGEQLGLSRDFIDRFEDEYRRDLAPLQSLILTMHDRGFCSENGDFGPEWQGVSEHDTESLGDETDW